VNRPLRDRATLSAIEHQTRVELAAMYRLFVHFRWTDLTYTHICARLPGKTGHFLLNPYGLLFEEVCASNLVEVGPDAEAFGEGRYNGAGYAIHATILRERPDVNFVLHSHTRAGVAVSAMKCGLLPLSQQANVVMESVAYHAYAVAEDDPAECARMAASLGDKPLLILHNHGLLSCGRTAAEAFLYHYFLQMACEIQIAVTGTAQEFLSASAQSVQSLSAWGKPRRKPWGNTQWEALMRLLDRTCPDFRN
jgi:ribulose-5-phosphate 4-epimerase/fuculose-1-phosphate aldolase